MPESLVMRLCFTPAYTELARLIGYLGLPVEEAHEKMKSLGEEHGHQAMIEAVSALIRVDDTKRAVLTDEARKACRGVLGPPPECWDDFYRHPNGEPDGQHAKKMKEYAQLQASGLLPPRKGTAAEALVAAPRTQSIEPAKVLTTEEQRLRKLNKRHLACMLRDARKSLAHNGKRSFVGKRAKEEIGKAEAEYVRRKLPIPAAGKETAAWDQKEAAETPTPADGAGTS